LTVSHQSRPINVHQSQYQQQSATSQPHAQRAPPLSNDAYADDSGAGLYEYGSLTRSALANRLLTQFPAAESSVDPFSCLLEEEDDMDRVSAPARIVEETGDRSAMKQMQSHGIPLKPTTVLRESARFLLGSYYRFDITPVTLSGRFETNLHLLKLQRSAKQSI
jgi:hypothetical protein